MKSSEQSAPGGGERDSMVIGALAERFGLATHVLRHWETMGLLTPARDAAGRRRYRITDLTRVAAILRAKDAGLSLDTIRSLTTTADAVQRRNILRAEAEALRSRIAAAQASLDLIECALGCDHEDVTQCAHFQQAVTDRIGTDTAVQVPD
ncbi:MerR family transcriptional regulator [Streptomyces venezuelae]|uniref:helix-turn-helix domain-containing protein n=1 Tax=Streptomyces venezuelae TaxID=54571 RepID=UPI00123A4BF0|nr:MerR family transcriptional regulator [Streptomyces venezuelae]QES09261.1 MerR family transcriptional regulator [Streptomyces venezuelae]